MFVVLLAVVACSRETPAPPPPQVATSPSVSPPFEAPRTTYAEAMNWFRSTPGFHFAIEENGVKATGELTRQTVGAERVRFTVGGEEWIAEAGPKGVIWRRGGKELPAPEWGNRMYQRVTVAFDPEKREGEAQVAGPGHFRFTDANSGQVHNVWVTSGGQISKMTIGDRMTMDFSLPK